MPLIGTAYYNLKVLKAVAMLHDKKCFLASFNRSMDLPTYRAKFFGLRKFQVSVSQLLTGVANMLNGPKSASCQHPVQRAYIYGCNTYL